MADIEKIIINEQSYPVKDVNAVSVLEQSLTDEQKAQVQTNIGVTAATNVYTKSETDTLLNGKINTTAKGISNGVAELDSNGKVPSSQLPSFVDDVVEGYYKTDNDRFYEESTFTTLIEPVAGKSWVDILTNKSYRWTGSVYVRVDEGVQIGETADTAYAGNKGKANADAIAAIKDGVSIDSFSDVETALAGKVDAVQGKGLSTNDYTSEEKTKLAGLENYDDTGIQGDISAIEEVIPSTATSQNQLATAADVPTDAVKYTEQDLTAAQQAQARTNIGAGTSNFSGDYRSLTNAPPLAINGGGAGGDIIGGTGVNENSTRYTNSVAYGALASAIADHAFAFGNHAFAGSNYGGKHAVAIGNNVRAQRDYEWAIGKFNQSNADTAFSIGDGTSDSDRHNLMELKTDGTLLLNGNAVKTADATDNKLRLGQIYELVNSNNSNVIKKGFGDVISAHYTKIVFSSSPPQSSVILTLYQFGDFITYVVNPYAVLYIVPLTGTTAGKQTTGKWVSVENCVYMFNACAALKTLDLSMFDTSEVKNMASMFYGCSALSSLDLTSFDTSEVTNMGSMFYNCSVLTSLDLSAFNTSAVMSMGYMFYGCTALTSLDISSFDLTNVISYNSMFGSSSSNRPPLTTLKTPKINPHDDIPLPRTLYSQDGTAYTNLPVTTGTSIELRQSWT